MREHNLEQAYRPVEFVKRQMASSSFPQVKVPLMARPTQKQAKGDEVPSFTSKMLREGLNEFEEEVIPWGGNSLYGGGTDTVRVKHTSPKSAVPH